MAKLTDLRLDVTSYCNEKCNFCPFHGIDRLIQKGDYIDVEHYERIATDLRESDIYPSIRLVGSGEPTVYPQFEELINTFKINNHRLKLITNGQRLSNFAQLIADSIDTLIVSVHGNEQTHDTLTGKIGSYETAMNGIRSIHSKNGSMNTILHFVITPDNYEEMESHVMQSLEIGCIPRFQHLVFTPGNKQLGSFDMTQLTGIIQKIKHRYPKVIFVPELAEDQLSEYYDADQVFIRQPHSCKRILTDVSIRYDGKVIMCDDRYLGDITQESIVSIINSDERIKFIKQRSQEAASEQGLPNTCSRCCYN